jgi:IMP dehydrogenase
VSTTAAGGGAGRGAPPADFEPDGYSAKDIFLRAPGCLGYTYDDLILMPGQITFGVEEVQLETMLTRNIRLRTPLVSSPMDTVTEHGTAIQMALHGGIGIVHYNMSIEEQVREVQRVKKYENGFIADPVCLTAAHTIADVDEVKRVHGFAGIPITVDGKVGSKLVGFVSNRDIDFIADRSTALADVMSTELVTATEPCTLEQANQLLRSSRKGKLPVVNAEGDLVSLISRQDLQKNRDYPLATKDANKNLRVGAAIGTRPDDRERAAALVAALVDVLVIDSSQGDSHYQHGMIKWLKTEFPHVDVIGGNIVTTQQAIHLIEAGADGLKVGMGVGSICTTQEVCAVGRAQASSVYKTCRVGRHYGVPIIADGGVSSSGHIVKALSIGASVVMCGSLFAGTEEAPGQYFFQDGVRVKKYRGMGSIEAMTKGSDARYFGSEATMKVAQGVSGSVVDKGSLRRYIPYLVQGLKHGMQDLGQKTLAQMHEGIDAGTVRFELRSPAAQREGGVHNMFSFEKRLFN